MSIHFFWNWVLHWEPKSGNTRAFKVFLRDLIIHSLLNRILQLFLYLDIKVISVSQSTNNIPPLLRFLNEMKTDCECMKIIVQTVDKDVNMKAIITRSNEHYLSSCSRNKAWKLYDYSIKIWHNTQPIRDCALPWSPAITLE